MFIILVDVERQQQNVGIKVSHTQQHKNDDDFFEK
jgi:hypothetical protein